MAAIRCLPADVAGPCRDPLSLTATGHAQHPRIKNEITGNLARGDLIAINGIVVHQTYSHSAQSTLNQYDGKNSNGAHFLIAKDGTIYQTASVFRQTYHVGKLRSRCLAEGKCAPVDPATHTAEQELARVRRMGPTPTNNYEKAKPFPDRYPNNSDSLGIELVGFAPGPDPAHPGELLYEDVTHAQNKSLTWLVRQLSVQFNVGFDAIFRHPMVSYKTPSEAATANWTMP